jgi:hypothetical protein
MKTLLHDEAGFFIWRLVDELFDFRGNKINKSNF